MEVRAEQVLVLGIAVIGALAVWQLLQPARDPNRQEPGASTLPPALRSEAAAILASDPRSVDPARARALADAAEPYDPALAQQLRSQATLAENARRLPFPPAPAYPMPLAVHGNLVQTPGAAWLRPGLVYRGRLEFDGTREQLGAFLRMAGFEPLAVYMSTAEAESENALLIDGATLRSRWFYGYWRGPEGTHVAVPREIAAIIPTAAPHASRALAAGRPRLSPAWGLA